MSAHELEERIAALDAVVERGGAKGLAARSKALAFRLQRGPGWAAARREMKVTNGGMKTPRRGVPTL